MNKLPQQSKGLIFAVSAYTLWGLLPIFWHLLREASALEILVNRGIWSLVFCLILLAFRKELKRTFAVIRQPRTLALLTLSSTFLTINWGVYIWSVSVNRVVEAALGYYITPLFSVAFGVIIFRERMRKAQWSAVLLAAIGVITLTIEYGALPWIALALALSWGSYSVLKKVLNLAALQGLSVETAVAFLPNLFYLSFLESQGRAKFGENLGISLLLISAGLITIIPLLLFNGAMVRLPLSMTGLLQYITPTIMFILGTFVNHEAMPLMRIMGFSFIWVALFLLGTDLVRSNRTSSSALQN